MNFPSFAFIIPLKGAKFFGSPVFKSKVSHSTFGGEVGGKATKLRSFLFFPILMKCNSVMIGVYNKLILCLKIDHLFWLW